MDMPLIESVNKYNNMSLIIFNSSVKFTLFEIVQINATFYKEPI
jgi:hypothetical protein